jgi:hypothetical protein
MQRVLEAVVVLLFPIRLRRHKQAIGDANETRAIAARTIEKAKRGRDAVGRLRSGKQRAQAPFVDEILQKARVVEGSVADTRRQPRRDQHRRHPDPEAIEGKLLDV